MVLMKKIQIRVKRINDEKSAIKVNDFLISNNVVLVDTHPIKTLEGGFKILIVYCEK